MITPDFSRGRKVTKYYIKILIFILISLRYEYCTQIRVVRYKIQTVIKSRCLSKSKQLLHIICNCFHQHQMSFKYYQTRSSSSCGGLEALWALLEAFGPPPQQQHPKVCYKISRVPTMKIGHFQIKTLCYKNCGNKNFLFESCYAGYLES